MTNRTARPRNRCTWLGASGQLCGRPKLEGCPYAICEDHARKLYDFMLHTYPPREPTAAENELARRDAARKQWEAMDLARREAMKTQSQVYYVRIYDHVKIGYTNNIKFRMSQLRVDLDCVMATEPGDQRLERQRHLEFAAERVGRRENFNPSPRLLAHIERVRELNGEPNITTWVGAQSA